MAIAKYVRIRWVWVAQVATNVVISGNAMLLCARSIIGIHIYIYINALSLTEITFAVKMRAHDINYTQSFSFLFRFFFFNFFFVDLLISGDLFTHSCRLAISYSALAHTRWASSNVLWRRQQYSEIKWINYYYSCVAYRTSISCEQEQPELVAFLHIYHVRCGRCHATNSKFDF